MTMSLSDREIADFLAIEIRPREVRAAERRELVVKMVLGGQSRDAIAKELGVSKATISQDISVMRKRLKGEKAR